MYPTKEEMLRSAHTRNFINMPFRGRVCGAFETRGSLMPLLERRTIDENLSVALDKQYNKQIKRCGSSELEVDV
jgi:hypothetical protein